MKRVRFWVWENGGWVRLTLREGQELNFCQGGPTEEGYHWEHTRWYRLGDIVVRERESDGRDCDGRLETWQSDYCPLTRLESRAAYWEGEEVPMAFGRQIRLPEWEEYRPSRQRDYTAEAMGY